jgi:hypothetical protein
LVSISLVDSWFSPRNGCVRRLIRQAGHTAPAAHFREELIALVPLDDFRVPSSGSPSPHRSSDSNSDDSSSFKFVL